MLHSRLMALAALLLTASCAKAPPPDYFDSLRLVSAMREDEIMLLAVRSAKASKLDAQDAACLDRYEFTELTDIPARRISDHMTAAEVEDALSYFHSPGGRKFVRRAELELTGKPADTAEPTAAERAELEQFKQRPAGRKLLQDRITADSAAMAEATTRFDRQVEDCTYMRQSQLEMREPQAVCKSKSVASADNVCLANYIAEGSGSARKARVEAYCRHHGKTLRSEVDMPPDSPVALRWSPSRELQILIQNDRLRIVSQTGAQATQRFSVAIRKPGDPPVLECLPAGQLHASVAPMLPMSTTMAAWRAHRLPGICFMTARVPKEQIPGAKGDVVMQFRRHQTAALPFATSRLAFIAEILEQPAQVSIGSNRLELVSHQPQLYMLQEKDAQALLQNLNSQPAELTVQPEGLPPYPVTLSRQDFDFAYADFAECLAGLKST